MFLIHSLTFSVFCQGEFPQYFVVHYGSTQEQCPDVVSVVSPELLTTEGEVSVWQIESVVELGENCEYTLHLTSRNAAGETNTSGSLSISQFTLCVDRK